MIDGAAAAELEIGAEAGQPEHRVGVARIEIGVEQRLLHGVDGGGHRIRVGPFVEEEAGDRPSLRRRRHGPTERLEASDGLEQRLRLTVESDRWGRCRSHAPRSREPEA